jgi:hypothetical protein
MFTIILCVIDSQLAKITSILAAAIQRTIANNVAGAFAAVARLLHRALAREVARLMASVADVAAVSVHRARPGAAVVHPSAAASTATESAATVCRSATTHLLRRSASTAGAILLESESLKQIYLWKH